MSSGFKTFPSPFPIIILTSFVNCRNGGQRTIQSSIQDTMGKKGKAPSSKEKKMAPLYTNTAYNRDAGIATWEGMYNLLEEEKECMPFTNVSSNFYTKWFIYIEFFSHNN